MYLSMYTISLMDFQIQYLLDIPTSPPVDGMKDLTVSSTLTPGMYEENNKIYVIKYVHMYYV